MATILSMSGDIRRTMQTHILCFWRSFQITIIPQVTLHIHLAYSIHSLPSFLLALTRTSIICTMPFVYAITCRHQTVCRGHLRKRGFSDSATHMPCCAVHSNHILPAACWCTYRTTDAAAFVQEELLLHMPQYTRY